jgi:exopolysaccharide biosynthesis predicted pyruvyltransferase EpsI
LADATSLTLITELQGKIRSCLGEFVTRFPVALLDFPDIRNVGDSAIWLGEIAYLTKHHKELPTYVSDMRNYSMRKLASCMPDGPIFIHGGGNFGDIWVAHQEFRERVLKDWPGRQVIQLPQSIHYSSDTRAIETARVIDGHKNFVLLVRDEESKYYAEKRFNCRIILCPDMAFCIGPVSGKSPALPVLAMLREDREKRGTHDLAQFSEIPVEDWISEAPWPIRFAKIRGAFSAFPNLSRVSMRRAKYNAAAHHRFRRGIRQIERAHAIVTDRLHVHILSLLLGRPHAVLDNNYGKIGRFIEAFSGRANVVYRAKSLADAIEWARCKASLSDTITTDVGAAHLEQVEHGDDASDFPNSSPTPSKRS